MYRLGLRSSTGFSLGFEFYSLVRTMQAAASDWGYRSTSILPIQKETSLGLSSSAHPKKY